MHFSSNGYVPIETEAFAVSERFLLSVAGFFVAVNQIALVIVADWAIWRIWPVFVWIAAAIGGHLALNHFAPKRDRYLFPAAMLLAGWSLNLVNRLVPNFTTRQALWVIVGILVMIGICALPRDLRWLRQYRYTLLVVGLGLLALTIILGVNPSGGGPRLWLGFGEWFYQPSELLKILLVVFLASYFADYQTVFRQDWRRKLPSPRYLGPIALMSSLCIVLLVWQRDLGTASIFFMVFLLMLYVASGEILLLFGGAALLLVAGIASYFAFDVVALRVDIWLNPWRDADNTSFQIVQSIMAIAEGGVFGSGIGQGIPTFIPVVHTDFAYAAIAEEWGLLGALSVMAALVLIFLRGLRIVVALQHQPFRAYLALGLCILLMVQSALIIGGALNVVPLTGVTLPFVSYGGSSMLTSFISIGLLIKLSQDL